MSTVADVWQNLTLHPHPQRNEWVTECFCKKSDDQVIEENAADYLNQTAQRGVTVRERQIHDGIQSGVFTFLPSGVSQAADCDSFICSVTFNGQNFGRQR